jgi:hypothetical protein
VLLAAVLLRGQEPVPPEQLQWATRLFQPAPAEKTLACAVRPLAPVLTYHLVYRAGFLLNVSMEQFAGAQGPVDILVRVTPTQPAAQPLLLRETGDLPTGSDQQGKDASKYEARVQGGFYLGEGDYRAELVMTDSLQRICRAQWDLKLKPHTGIAARLSPGQLAAFSHLDLPRLGARAGNLTVLLHAGSPRLNTVLLQSLASIFERMPFHHVQVVAFSLDQHKELLRESLSDASDLRHFAEALNSYNPSVVSYGVLQDPAGHRDFLWSLLAKEELRKEPADVVLFVGYSTFDDSHIFAPPACVERGRKTLYAYFDYAPPTRRRILRPGFGGRRINAEAEEGPWEDVPVAGPMQPEMPDAISRITRACSGKVFRIYSPADLSSALDKTAELLPRH